MSPLSVPVVLPKVPPLPAAPVAAQGDSHPDP